MGLLGCGLPCIRLDSAGLGAPESIRAAGPVVFLVLLGGAGLPFLGPASVLALIPREPEDPNRGKGVAVHLCRSLHLWTMGAPRTGQKGLKQAEKGQKQRIFWGALVFYRDFRTPKEGKT